LIGRLVGCCWTATEAYRFVLQKKLLVALAQVLEGYDTEAMYEWLLPGGIGQGDHDLLEYYFSNPNLVTSS
jgi:hypothetical protein